MPLPSISKDLTAQTLTLLHQKITAANPTVLTQLLPHAPAGTTPQQLQASLASDLSDALAFLHSEPTTEGEVFHSRSPLAGLAQSQLAQPQLAQPNPVTHNDAGDALPAIVNLFGEGNPLVWAPVLVNILVEHLAAKAPFVAATDARSLISISDQCTIALLGDWGADNDHAQRIAALVVQAHPDYVIHLGDIYYAGNQYECERFLANWPTAGQKKSFALNGNHEMYSRAIPYFNTVLPAFGQEASYFTLTNTHWQIHGLDTAYVPFSIDGSVPPAQKPSLLSRIADVFHHANSFDSKPDARLQSQRDWLVQKVSASPEKKNILLSHNQPVSAYLPEFQAGNFLHDQFRALYGQFPHGWASIHAWFFGHEHKCTLYDDTKTDFRARLIGNGAIPHNRQALIAAQKDETSASCTPVFTMNDRALRPDLLGTGELDLAISGFVLLHFNGPDLTVEYINEDGSLFLRELLTGTPNQVLEWGPDYGPAPASS